MNNQELQADLAKVAAEYNHSVLQQAVLENYKESILLLRAKFASYEKIAELLNQRGIKVFAAGFTGGGLIVACLFHLLSSL